MTEEILQQIVERLQGTCDTLDAACEECGIEWENLTGEDHAYIDNEIFKCEQCGWWYEVSDSYQLGEDQVCNDCNGNIDE